jgi:hypothetical protein
MSHGPIILYDKSFLQGINQDEAFWLGMHFTTNLSPVLVVEVLGNLHKPPPSGRSAEDVVRSLATKVADIGTQPNVSHIDLTIGELLGYKFPLSGIPIVRGSRRIRKPDGGVGTVIEQPPEMEALNRWHEQDFLAVERLAARSWRDAIERIDLKTAAKLMRSDTGVYSFSDFAAVKAVTDQAASPRNSRYRQLRHVLTVYEVPEELRPTIIERWKAAGGPTLTEFAPFTHHRLSVDLFFNLAIASGHISTDRPTNKIDMAYLYYLPFCQVFVSGDRLHEKLAPLFLRPNQQFVPARALKADLAKLVTYYDELPEEVKAIGAMKYAAFPPIEGDFLTCRLHDRFLPGWRTRAANPVQLTPEGNADIVARVQALIDAAKAKPAEEVRTVDQAEDDEMAVQYMARRQVGRWKLF